MKFKVNVLARGIMEVRVIPEGNEDYKTAGYRCFQKAIKGLTLSEILLTLKSKTGMVRALVECKGSTVVEAKSEKDAKKLAIEQFEDHKFGKLPVNDVEIEFIEMCE